LSSEEKKTETVGGCTKVKEERKKFSSRAIVAAGRGTSITPLRKEGVSHVFDGKRRGYRDENAYSPLREEREGKFCNHNRRVGKGGASLISYERVKDLSSRSSPLPT